MPQWIRALPGFRTGTPWKQYLAGSCYLCLLAILILGPLQHKLLSATLLAAILLATNTWGLRTQLPAFRSEDRVKASLAWSALAVVGLVSLRAVAGTLESPPQQSSPQVATLPVATALPAEKTAVPFDQDAADDHLINARDYLDSGELGLALVEITQALAVAPAYDTASLLQTEVRTQATAIARDIAAQAAAQAQAARAEATAQAQTARAEATAKAQAAADSRLDELGKEFSSVLDGANRAAGTRFFVRYQIKLAGSRVEVTISDLWYSAAKFQQERLVNIISGGYVGLAEKHGVKGYPTTSLVDTFGKEVAFNSFLRGTVIN